MALYLFHLAGALVMYARLLESDVEPSYVDRPFDPKAAAADPFGVGSVTPQEVQTALHAAIQSRLDDHPTEWANIVYEKVISGVFAYKERETRQDLAAAGWIRDSPEPKPTPPPPL